MCQQDYLMQEEALPKHDYTPKLESAVDEGMKRNSNLLPYW